jgi:hypothetical protein
MRAYQSTTTDAQAILALAKVKGYILLAQELDR